MHPSHTSNTAFNAVLALACYLASFGPCAAALNNGDVLAIRAGTQLYDANNNPADVSAGSWFGMNTTAVFVAPRCSLQAVRQ